MDDQAAAPFLIEAVEVASSGGWIGITPCPGTHRFPARLEPWERDLEGDFDAIAAWGPVAVVTLMREREIRRPSIDDIRRAAERRGLEWHHLPIVDAGVPDGKFETCWQRSGPGLRAILRAGRRVLVHCQGGLGRSGMIAARLLVELGERPAAAIERVRAARPGAIETEAQAAHVRACRAVVEPER
jgi:protein tyrosine phosphatase (PTP) superfamily phosphohydrolase (DUF442 family)